MTPVPEVAFDAAAHAADRNAYFDELRDLGPLVRVNGAYCPTRQADMLDALRNPALSTRIEVSKTSTSLGSLGRRMASMGVPHMCDPPEHTRMRRILQPFFSSRGLAPLQAALQTQVTALVAAVAAKGRCEVMRDIAGPLPAQALLMLLGLPLADRDRLVYLRDAVNSGVKSECEGELVVYLTKAIRAEASRRRPGVGVLPRLVASGELNHSQVLGFLWLAIFAGIEPISAVIGYALYELARNPRLRSQLRESREQIEAFADEVVRLHPPLPVANRVATEQVTVAGVTLPAGSRVTGLLDAANHEGGSDISVADDGTVQRQRHLGYGGGIHHCLGVHLAKMEISLVLTEWLRRIPDFELEPGFTLEFTGRNVSTLASLPLRFTTRMPLPRGSSPS